MILPGFVIWVLLTRYLEAKKNNQSTVKGIAQGLGTSLLTVLPSAVFLLLMLTTSAGPAEPGGYQNPGHE